MFTLLALSACFGTLSIIKAFKNTIEHHEKLAHNIVNDHEMEAKETKRAMCAIRVSGELNLLTAYGVPAGFVKQHADDEEVGLSWLIRVIVLIRHFNIALCLTWALTAPIQQLSLDQLN